MHVAYYIPMLSQGNQPPCSCHYVANPVEVKKFWLFEGSIFSVGLLAYAVVVYRIKTLDRLTAHRIQQQINA